MRPQIAADGVEQHPAILNEDGDDAADVPVRFLHPGFRQRRDISFHDVRGPSPYPAVAILGLIVTFLGLSCSVGYLWLGQRMLGQEHGKKLYRALVLAVVFPSGLILANTRATFEAFFSTRMDFTRTLRAGEIHAGGWRGAPELMVGVFVAAVALAESANWSALFFVFAVSGLVSIGAMGATSGMGEPVRQRITPGE